MRNRGERGFAMLLVFAMAAAVAIMLYAELPRAAFESQRAKEEMLIDRGEQYKRAIQLYIISFKKYPQSMDDLEKNTRQRFLRHRYIDPMTGKDEWRLIHATNGVVTDSKIKKNDKDKKAENTFITESAAVGSTSPTGASTGANLANRRRDSDAKLPDFPGGGNSVNPQDPNAPPLPPGQPGQPQAQQPTTTLPNGVQIPGFNPQTGQPNTQNPQGQPGQQGQQGLPGQPGIPGQPGQQNQQQNQNNFITAGPAIGSMPSTGQQQGAPGQAGVQPGFPQAGGYPNQTGMQPGRAGFGGGPAGPPSGNNQALSLIGQILTTPNPGMNPAAGAPQQGGGVMGSGIVGVASKFEGDSIKIYGERQKYDEWEFIYDPQKDKRNQTNVPQGNNPGNQQQKNTNQSSFGR